MTCIKDVPTLKGDNYGECHKKVDIAFICAEVEWVLSEPQPKQQPKPVKATEVTDAESQKKERDYVL